MNILYPIIIIISLEFNSEVQEFIPYPITPILVTCLLFVRISHFHVEKPSPPTHVKRIGLGNDAAILALNLKLQKGKVHDYYYQESQVT